MPQRYVKAYAKRQKNHTSDAEAVCEAASRPTMRFVTVKTEEQQARDQRGVVKHEIGGYSAFLRFQAAAFPARPLPEWMPSAATLASPSTATRSRISANSGETTAFRAPGAASRSRPPGPAGTLLKPDVLAGIPCAASIRPLTGASAVWSRAPGYGLSFPSRRAGAAGDFPGRNEGKAWKRFTRFQLFVSKGGSRSFGWAQ